MFEPGVCTNPDGTPRSLFKLLRDELKQKITTTSGEVVTRREQIACEVVAAALRGDMAAVRLLWERLEVLPGTRRIGYRAKRKEEEAQRECDNLAAQLQGAEAEIASAQEAEAQESPCRARRRVT